MADHSSHQSRKNNQHSRSNDISHSSRKNNQSKKSSPQDHQNDSDNRRYNDRDKPDRSDGQQQRSPSGNPHLPAKTASDNAGNDGWRRGWMDQDTDDQWGYSEEAAAQPKRERDDSRYGRADDSRYDRSMYGRQIDRDEYSHIYDASREYASVRSRRDWQYPDDDSEYAPVRSPVRRRSAYDEYDREASPRRRPFYTDFFEKIQTSFTAAIAVVPASKWWKKYPIIVRISKVKHIRLILAAVILFGVVGPSLLAAYQGYQEYTQLKTLGLNGVHELLAIKSTVSAATKAADPNSGIEGKGRAALQPAVLSQIKAESDAAKADFQQLHTMLAQRQGVLIVVGITPYNNILESLQHVSQIGIDVAQMGQKFAAAGGSFAPIFQGKLLDPTGPPILTPAVYDTLMQFIASIQGDLNDLAQQFAEVNVSILPIPAVQKAQFQQIAPVIGPIAQGVNTVIQQKDALRWLLGVDSPRLLLTQTMDRGELRADGGFTGQFGVLTINGGRIGKISLTDIGSLDRGYNLYGKISPYANHPVPATLQPAMPFADNGLKESGIYPDFPTSAKLAMTMFPNEGGPHVDGVINFSPLVIEHLLAPNVLGSLTVPCYNETVTSDNLEQLIHEYQLGGDPKKFALQQKCGGDSATSLRKQFTGALSSELQDHLRKASPDAQGKTIASILSDLKSKELEIYLNNAAGEAWLANAGNAGAQITDPNVDTTQVVQTNIAGNKSAIYVATTLQEKIAITSSGDAQHNLTLTIAYDTHGNSVFPFCLNDSYPTPGTCSIDFRDFIRIYLPKSAQQVTGTGFEQVNAPPMCTNFNCLPPNYPVCQKTVNNPKGVFQIIDPVLNYTPYQGSGYQGEYFYLGGPTYTGSNITNAPGYGLDGAGLAVYGGLSVIPDGCAATVTLQWVVPHIANGANSQHPYTFIEQNQSDVFPNTTIQISGHGVSPLTKQITGQTTNITITDP